MNTTESIKNQVTQKSKSGQKSEALNNNNHMLFKDKKYRILRQLRIKLGKSKEEFHKLFELYNQLVKQENG